MLWGESGRLPIARVLFIVDTLIDADNLRSQKVRAQWGAAWLAFRYRRELRLVMHANCRGSSPRLRRKEISGIRIHFRQAAYADFHL